MVCIPRVRVIVPVLREPSSPGSPFRCPFFAPNDFGIIEHVENLGSSECGAPDLVCIPRSQCFVPAFEGALTPRVANVDVGTLYFVAQY